MSRRVCLEIATQPRHVLEFSQPFSLDLPNSLATDSKFFPDFPKRALIPAIQTEAQSQDLPLARMQLIRRPPGGSTNPMLLTICVGPGRQRHRRSDHRV